VTVDKDGKLYFDGAETTEEELRSKLAAVVKKNKDTIAVITADQALNYGRVMRVIDIVKTEGVAKFALNIKTEVTPAPTP
jgi:biopolymer transport protein TolR